jgi:drug/metabolite transporter (DMT)-like permease
MVTLAAALLGRERLTPARSAALLVASGGTLLMLLGAGGLRFDPIGVAWPSPPRSPTPATSSSPTPWCIGSPR